MIRRARLLSVVATLTAGALGVVSSTQTWLTVALADTSDELLVPGAAAIPVLAPLSLAVLALGLALSIVGRVLRYAFAALSLAIALVLGLLTWRVLVDTPTSAFSSTVTQATGITGEDAVSQLVSRVTTTPWPVVTLVGWVVLLAASALVLTTAHAWRSAGRRYDAAAGTTAGRAASSGPSAGGDAAPRAAASRPADHAESRRVDDWDELSRGEDPTSH
jgi:hypothetical protein